MTKTKLNQVIAVEKAAKGRIMGEITRMHQQVQKPALLGGFSKTYQKRDEDGDDHPPERQRVQVSSTELLRSAGRLLSELFDVTAAKDWANTRARGDVVVEGEILLEQVPATFLLFLEKQLTDLRTFVSTIPVLDPAEDWTLDPITNLWRTEPTQTTRTKKVQRPIVLYPATEEHPAQTQLISEDVVVGTWLLTKQSGALPEPRKQQLLERIETLAKAVKFARETANAVEAPEQTVGGKVFEFLFA